MSKKLIAAAAAAALALTGLVGIAPANATAATIVYTDSTGVSTLGTTAATAMTALVPQTNALTDGSTVLKIVVSGLEVGDTVTVGATAPAKVTTALIGQSTLFDVTTFGLASVTDTVASGVTSTLYVYTTSTTVVSTISITVNETDGTTKSITNAVRYIKGLSASTDGSSNVFKVKNVVAPTVLVSGADSEVTFNVTDAFDNVLETAAIAGALTTSVGTLTGSGIATWDAVRKLHVAEVTSTTANPFVLTIDGNGTLDAPENLGLGASSTTFAVVVNNAGVSDQIASLTAQIAALQVIVDRKVTKKRYNTLARKWNRAFPSQKVWVKP